MILLCRLPRTIRLREDPEQPNARVHVGGLKVDLVPRERNRTLRLVSKSVQNLREHAGIEKEGWSAIKPKVIDFDRRSSAADAIT